MNNDSQMVRSLVGGYMIGLQDSGVVECSPSALVDHVRKELVVYGRHDLNDSDLPIKIACHMRKDHWQWRRFERRGSGERYVWRRNASEQSVVIELSREDLIAMMLHAELVMMGGALSAGVSQESLAMAEKVHSRLQDLFLAMSGVDTRAKLEI